MKFRTFVIILITLSLFWLGGYFWYMYSLSEGQQLSLQRTDGIVVLTGGQNRLPEAASLLQNKTAGRLFISGVHIQVTRRELLKVLNVPVSLADCCIEIGRDAKNTVGNAEETSLWVTRHKIKSLRVVTSLEHMPRAMIEFKRFMPDTTFVAHPVGKWQPKNMKFTSTAREYSKYLVSLIRSRLLEMMLDDTPVSSETSSQQEKSS